MQYEEFVARVDRLAGLEPRSRARDVIAATLHTLAERIQSNTASNLASQLPPELAPYLARPSDLPGQRFGIDEFWRRVAERSLLDRHVAQRVARAVLEVLTEAVAPGELRHVWKELPTEYLDLYANAAPHGGRESGLPGGGQGRVDDVGGSGVYPASSTDSIPKDAQAQGMASWGQGSRGAAGYDDSGGSELVWRDGQVLGGLTSDASGRPTIDTQRLDEKQGQ
jgi:uncharacterized protein (DUF2267 family)